MCYVRMVINIPMYITDIILEMDIRIQVEYGGRSFSHIYQCKTKTKIQL